MSHKITNYQLPITLLLLLLSVPSLADAPTSQHAPVTRTKAEVDKLIDDAGKTPPPWWDTTTLNVPPTLELSWKKTPGEKWNNQKTMDAYLWDIIYPNPSKWHEGVKLIVQSINANKGNQAVLTKSAAALADMYTQMLQDYARGAYWAKKAGDSELMQFELAECYLKLGCKAAAIEILNNVGRDDTATSMAVKLWGEMGDLKNAFAWAESLAEEGHAAPAYVAAADAARNLGDIPNAIAYYKKVLEASTNPNDRNRKRAQANLDVIKLFESLDLSKIPDGTFKAESQAYVGPLEVAVTVAAHRITTVEVTHHKEKQFYSSIAEIPPQIVAKQSVKGIDTVTGATITSEAIINATAKALAAKQNP